MFGWRILLWAVLVLTALIFLYLVRAVLLPFILAFIIAAVLEPSVRRLRLRGYPRFWAVFMVFFVFFGLLAGVGVLAAPTVVREVTTVTKKFEEFTTNLTQVNENNNFFVRWNPAVQAQQSTTKDQIDVLLAQVSPTLKRFGLPSTRRAITEQYIEPRRAQIAQGVKSAFGSFFGILGNITSELLAIFLVPLIVWMLLMNMEEFKRRSPRWIPPTIRASTLALMSDIGDVFIKYLRGMATVIGLYTAGAILILLLFNVPYGVLLGILFGALYIVPYVGTLMNLIVLALVIGLSGTNGTFFIPALASPWVYAAIVLAVYIGYGLVFDHMIYPQMVGASVGLNGVVSLFVIACGFALFGLVGMIIAFPLAGSLKVILDRIIRVTSTTQDGLHLPAVPLRHRTTPTG